jgi:hypothetical protein
MKRSFVALAVLLLLLVLAAIALKSLGIDFHWTGWK